MSFFHSLKEIYLPNSKFKGELKDLKIFSHRYFTLKLKRINLNIIEIKIVDIIYLYRDEIANMHVIAARTGQLPIFVLKASENSICREVCFPDC